MIKSIHKRLFKSHSSFGYAAVCALIIGVGDLIATGTDIYWLIGDMRLSVHPHHIVTMVGLVTAELIMIGSFVWLYRAIDVFLIKKANKAKAALETGRKRRECATHCNIKKIPVTNNYLKYVPAQGEE